MVYLDTDSGCPSLSSRIARRWARSCVGCASGLWTRRKVWPITLRFTDVQVFLPRVESITLHDVPGEEHETEMVIHDELGATVSIRLISDRRIRLTDLRRR